MIASQHGQLATVETLIEGGANPNAIGMGRGSRQAGGDIEVNALHLAAFHSHWEVFGALEQAGARPTIHENVDERLEQAGAVLGQELARNFCGNCHVVKADMVLLKEYRPGPSLIGVFGRPIGSLNEYEYSEALHKAEGVWNADMLYSFAASANLALPGSYMVFNDGWDADDVLHITAYFASLSE